MIAAIRRRDHCAASRSPRALCGTAFKNKGVQTLARRGGLATCRRPSIVPPITGHASEASRTASVLERPPSDPDAPMSALAFKLFTDPYVGHLTYLRVYSGVLRSRRSPSINASRAASKERVGRLLKMHANSPVRRSRRSPPATSPRPWASRSRPRPATRSGGSEATAVVLESMEFADPVISQAIEPKTREATRRRWARRARQAHRRGSRPSASHTDEATGQTIVSGMGELHLEIIVDRLQREFGVGVNVGRPQVAYRETFTQARRGRVGKPHEARAAATASTAS